MFSFNTRAKVTAQAQEIKDLKSVLANLTAKVQQIPTVQESNSQVLGNIHAAQVRPLVVTNPVVINLGAPTHVITMSGLQDLTDRIVNDILTGTVNEEIGIAPIRRGPDAGRKTLRRFEAQYNLDGEPANVLVIQESNSWQYPGQKGCVTVWWGDRVAAIASPNGWLYPGEQAFAVAMAH